MLFTVAAGFCLVAVRSGAYPKPAVEGAKPVARQAIPPEAQACARCHAEEVAGFLRSKMARSMRMGGAEPKGSVSGAGFSVAMSSDAAGSWQTLKTAASTERFHVDYVIGSGTRASGFLTDIDGHLFQSPVAYYAQKARYDMAPGFRRDAEADFTRAVKPGCVFCHAGSFDAIAGTENAYRTPPLPHLAIGCERCHGPTAEHVRRPSAQNIVNPEALRSAARDSVCEQCHLIGVARILNPGKLFSDFHAGEPSTLR